MVQHDQLGSNIPSCYNVSLSIPSNTYILHMYKTENFFLATKVHVDPRQTCHSAPHVTQVYNSLQPCQTSLKNIKHFSNNLESCSTSSNNIEPCQTTINHLKSYLKLSNNIKTSQTTVKQSPVMLDLLKQYRTMSNNCNMIFSHAWRPETIQSHLR